MPAPVGPYLGGQTGRISKIDGQGNVSTVATGLASTVDSMGDLMGVADVAFLDGSLYGLVAGGGCSHGNPLLPNGIYKIDQTTGAGTLFANLDTYIKLHPSEYENPSDFEPDGSFYSMIVKGGPTARLMTISPFNCFFEPVAGLRDSNASLNIVHSKAGFTTIVGLNIGPDGLVYVLQLSDASGYPTPGVGDVVRISATGQIESVATG